MSLALSLTNVYALPHLSVPALADWKVIFRTSPAGALPRRQAGLVKAGPALKIAAEALTLLGVSVGLFSLFLGLAVL